MPLMIHRHAGTLTNAQPGTSGAAGPWVVRRHTLADFTVRSDRPSTSSGEIFAISGSLRLPRG